MKQDALVLLMLAGSLSLNVYLAVALRGRPERGPEVRPLAVGTRLPMLVGRALDGMPLTGKRDSDSRDIAVYVFSRSCSWCEKNMNNIRTLVQRKFAQYRFLGVSTGPTDGLSEYCQQHGINFEVMTSVSEALRSAYNMAGTPQLIVVSADGSLKRVFSGAWADQKKEEAERFFGTALPGLEGPLMKPNKPGLVDGQCIDSWGARFDQGFSWPVEGLMQTCSPTGWARKPA